MADICHVGLGRRVRRMVRSRFPWFQRRRVPGGRMLSALTANRWSGPRFRLACTAGIAFGEPSCKP